MQSTRVVNWGTFRPALSTLQVSHLDTFPSPLDGSATTQTVDTVFDLTAPENATIATTLLQLQSVILARLSTANVTATAAAPTTGA